MNKEDNILSNLRYDLPASIVVFFVALPLCLGIALASGAPLFSGVVAGIIGGVVVGMLSGSQLGVSGPAAGLAVIVLSAITKLGSFEAFLLAVVFAGLIQIAFGLLKAGVIGYYFPSAVIKGMLSGIGIIIFLKQIPHFFGYDRDPEGDLAFEQADGHNTLSELYYALDFFSPGAILISLISLAILLTWESKKFRKMKMAGIIPGPLIVVVTGVILKNILEGFEGLSIGENHLVNIPRAASTDSFFSTFTMPDFSQVMNREIYILAFTIAVVASLETLLCLEAADKLDPRRRITPTNRELLAQGAGNIFSGLIGGLPITQVIVRSSANIQSGARTKLSTILHGLLIFTTIIVIPDLLNQIPLASLASILLVVGYKLTNPPLFRKMYAGSRSQFLSFIVTVVGLILTDLLTGIGLGMSVAILQILWNNYQASYHFDPEKHRKGEPILITLSEDVTFLNKASILQTLDKIPDNATIILDGSLARNIHPDVIEIIDNFTEGAPHRNITVEKVGFAGSGKNGQSRKHERIEVLENGR